MPQPKEPKKLFCFCIKEMVSLVKLGCANIEKKYGSYKNQECVNAVKNLQNYFLERLPIHIFDEMCHNRKLAHEDILRIKDPETELRVYIHKDIQSFSVKFSEFKYELEDGFIMSCIPIMRNIVFLNLELVATDEILEIVGKNCLLLTEINIVSRMAPMNIILGLVGTRTPFNAMKIQYFVSDTGLSHISNCKKLRKVTMNKKLKSQQQGQKITLEGIRNLVKSLPDLELVTFDDMGQVLSEGMDDMKLSLTEITDHHPSYNQVSAIKRLCPKLNDLTLLIPRSDNIAEDGSDTHVLNSMCDNELQVSNLVLLNFQYSESFVNYFISYGFCITSLHCSYIPIVPYVLYLLGFYCRHINHLHIDGNGNTDIIQHKSLPENVNSCQLFSKLVCLNLEGTFDPQTVAKIVLNNAKNIQSISFSSLINQSFDCENMFNDILMLNPLTKIGSLILGTGFFSTICAVYNFINMFPDLSVLMFRRSENITNTEIAELNKRMFPYQIFVHCFN